MYERGRPLGNEPNQRTRPWCCDLVRPDSVLGVRRSAPERRTGGSGPDNNNCRSVAISMLPRLWLIYLKVIMPRTSRRAADFQCAARHVYVYVQKVYFYDARVQVFLTRVPKARETNVQPKQHLQPKPKSKFIWTCSYFYCMLKSSVYFTCCIVIS